MSVTSKALSSIKAGIKKSGYVYLIYDGNNLHVIRSDSSKVNRLNFNHLIGVYNGKAADIDIFDDINSFIEDYTKKQTSQSQRLNKQVGLAD